MSLAKPTPRERAKPTRPMPRCVCRHGQRQHVPVSSTGNPVTRWMGCLICPMGKCDSYRAPSVSVRRSPIQRASAPIKRKTKVRKQRKTGRAALARLADKLAGEICRARGACEACGAGPQAVLQWAHLFSRRYHAVRWNLLNCACLCRACHFKFGLRPIEWDEWMRTALGQPAYDELRRLALKNERVDLAATVAALRAELARMGG